MFEPLFVLCFIWCWIPQVFFDALIIQPEGRDPIKLDPAKLDKNKIAFTLKEKAKYTIKLEFRVQRDIVLGLKRHQRIYKKGKHKRCVSVLFLFFTFFVVLPVYFVFFIDWSLLFFLFFVLGIRMENSMTAIGSYAPTNKKTYDFTFDEEIVPDGMLARGNYTAKTGFIDDDKTLHLEFEYGFKIAKDW